MKKIIIITFNKSTGIINASELTASEAVTEYYTRDEVVEIISGGHTAIVMPADMYDGPIHEKIHFDIKVIGDFVANIIKKEEDKNE